MNAPQHRLIQIDVTLIDPTTNQVHMETHEWELEPKEIFAGVAVVTGSEVKNTLPNSLEVKK
jgi:hypothetical protein